MIAPVKDQTGSVLIDRRWRKRYEIHLAVDVRALTPSQPVIAGWSIDISPIGVRIASDALGSYEPFPPGVKVIIAMTWPARRSQRAPVRLILIGDVVRCTPSDIAVRINRHYSETQEL